MRINGCVWNRRDCPSLRRLHLKTHLDDLIRWVLDDQRKAQNTANLNRNLVRDQPAKMFQPMRLPELPVEAPGPTYL